MSDETTTYGGKHGWIPQPDDGEYRDAMYAEAKAELMARTRSYMDTQAAEEGVDDEPAALMYELNGVYAELERVRLSLSHVLVDRGRLMLMEQTAEEVHTRTGTKGQAAEYHLPTSHYTWDGAIPQPWLDDMYRVTGKYLVAEMVWCYGPRNERGGTAQHPHPLTCDAVNALVMYEMRAGMERDRRTMLGDDTFEMWNEPKAMRAMREAQMPRLTLHDGHGD